MGSTFRSVFGVLATVVAASLVGVACQTPPASQTVPPGGRVIVTTPPGTYVELETASGDLARVVYKQGPWGQSTGSYQLYDDATGVTTQLPFSRRCRLGPTPGRWCTAAPRPRRS